jgi:hypothetical protein
VQVPLEKRSRRRRGAGGPVPPRVRFGIGDWEELVAPNRCIGCLNEDPRPGSVSVKGASPEGGRSGIWGPNGEIRFALIENDQRIGQAVRHLRAAATKLG